ncbi:hypothetical protein [uncultured Deinococcus sp.]|uniref:hypothetical protein n=1 Tax=uncultured Deinococcus sp. TaxID=158789 RepID=UPI003747F79F
MKNGKLILTTKFHENRPVDIGDLTIWSKRLNGEEEMLLQEMNMRAISSRAGDNLRAQVDVLRHLVQARVRDERDVTEDWVRAHLGQLTGDRLVSYLRTGQGLKAGETFSLPRFEDIELEGRRFTARALSFAEALASAEKVEELSALEIADEAAQLGGAISVREGESAEAMLDRVKDEALSLHARSVEVTRATADLVAQTLNSRVADGGEPITGAWLLSLLQLDDIKAITNYLRDGSTPDEEEEIPNAEADASAS